MITSFPILYPDELLYSLFARYYAQSGHIAYVFAAEDLFERRTTKPDIEFIDKLTPEAFNCIMKNMPLETAVMQHTMLPYYSRFLPLDRRIQALKMLLQMDERYHNLLYLPKSKTVIRSLRYCPLCALADRKQYGETYWHRSHQMSGVSICPIHHCRLNSSTVRISSKPSPSLDSAEAFVPLDEEAVFCGDDQTYMIAEYVHAVFQSPVDMESDIPVGRFLHSRMEYTKYVSPRGEQRNMALLFEDFIARFGAAPNNTIDAQWKRQKMLSGDRLGTYEVCLTAMFLGIASDELTRMRIPAISQAEWFDHEVRALRQQGIKYPEIARRMNAPYDVVKAIGEGRYHPPAERKSQSRSSS